MSGKISIQYSEVYAKTAELRNRIDNQLSEMDADYKQLQTRLQGMDSRTNAVFAETMMQNHVKACITSETLHRLLSFIELSAKQVEHDENVLKSMYTLAEGEGAATEGGVS